MNHPKALLDRLKKIPKITSMWPLLYRKGESTGVCKNGTLVSVLRLQGQDYTGMSSDKYDLAFNVRKRMFEKEKDFVRLDTISKKIKTHVDDNFHTHENTVNSLMIKTWKNNFKEIYRTHHYVIISVHDGGMLAKVGSLISESYNINPHEEMQTCIDELSLELKDYSPQLLKGDDLTSFFSSLINGRETHTTGHLWDSTLANQALEFDSSRDYCTYGRHGDQIYSGWLSIANYPDTLSQASLNKLFTLPIEFNLYQSFQTYTKKQASNAFELKYKQLNNWGDESGTLIEELEKIRDGVLSSDFSFLSHNFSLEILADSKEALEQKMQVVKTALESNKALFYKETTNIEALFWSRFPTMHKFNLRARDITSENAAHFATFNSIGEGFDTCGFGSKPVTMFKTEAGSQFSFTFHQTPEMKPDILGHTGVIGGTGAGKTTLIAFLIANCLSYDGFKAICFDRLKGLKVFTELFDGDYLDFPDDVQMNPFLLADNPKNRMFLFSWLKRLIKVEATDTTFDDEITKLIKTNFDLEKKDRCFEELQHAMGIEGGEFRKRFNIWLKKGQLGGFWNGEKDSFNFNKQIVTFDATTILDQPEILPVITDYVFHQIMMQVSESVTPHIIFFDEAPRYFKSPEFSNRMFEALKEVRKKAGVAILGIQNVTTLQELPKNAGKEVLGNLANLILYPNSSADKEEYMDYLGLNDTEFKWIKDNDAACRKVLFKRVNSGESVVLDIDFKNLKTPNYDLLNCFNSSVKEVLRMEELKKSDAANWKMKYLRR